MVIITLAKDLTNFHRLQAGLLDLDFIFLVIQGDDFLERGRVALRGVNVGSEDVE